MVGDRRELRTSVTLVSIAAVTLVHIAVLWLMLQTVVAPAPEAKESVRALHLIFIRESTQSPTDLLGISKDESSDVPSKPVSQADRGPSVSRKVLGRSSDSAPRHSPPTGTEAAPAQGEALEPLTHSPSGFDFQPEKKQEDTSTKRPLMLDYQHPQRPRQKSAVEMVREQLNPDAPPNQLGESIKKAAMPKCAEGDGGLLNLPLAILKYNNGKCKM